jgi:hypothetical protein
MRFTVVLFVLVAFISIVVGVLIVAPIEAMSIAYVLYAFLFSIPLVNILRGKTYATSNNSAKLVSNRWIFAAALLCALGGVFAFVAYWLTKDHRASIKILTVFTSLALLLLIFAGGKIESQ